MLLTNYKVSEQPYELLISPSVLPPLIGLVGLPIFVFFVFRDVVVQTFKTFDLEHFKSQFSHNPMFFVIILVIGVSILFNFVFLLKVLLLGRVRVDRVARTIYKNSQSLAGFDEIDKLSVKKPLLTRNTNLLLLLKSGKTLKLLAGNNPSELRVIAQKIGTMANVPVEPS